MTESTILLDGGKLQGELLLGTYYIEHLVGKGGMAWVYKASHIEMGTPFALKILFSQLSTNEEIRARFLREAAILQQLRHPHIVGIQDIIECHGLLGIVLEWCDGGDLKDWAVQHSLPLSLGQTHAIILPLLEAVAHAHQQGYIHRDLKLQNILLQRDGDHCLLKVTDFGVAKALTSSTVTQTGAMMGTLEFMSPEQLRDAKRIDYRADIYSLGVMMYFFCTGLYPFNGSQHQLIMQILSYEAPPPVGAPPQIVPLIMKCLAKESEDRFSSCLVLRDAWCEAVGDVLPEPIIYTPPPPAGRLNHNSSPTLYVPNPADARDDATTQVNTHSYSSAFPWLKWSLLFLLLAAIAVAASLFWSYILS